MSVRSANLRSLFELVCECVGDNTGAAVDAVSNHSRENLYSTIRNRYSELKPRKPPAKKPGEFVPGWLLDIVTMSESGFGAGNDLYFVVRAVLYSHRVALV